MFQIRKKQQQKKKLEKYVSTKYVNTKPSHKNKCAHSTEQRMVGEEEENMSCED